MKIYVKIVEWMLLNYDCHWISTSTWYKQYKKSSYSFYFYNKQNQERVKEVMRYFVSLNSKNRCRDHGESFDRLTTEFIKSDIASNENS